MSDALIVRRGGSGGLSLHNAVIHVNAEVGSTITFSKGGVAVKILGPSKGHISSDGKTADYYYSVSSVNFGSWTITGALGGQSAGKTVTVNEVKQYDVPLSYNLYLIKDGRRLRTFTFAVSDSAYSLTDTASGYMEFKAYSTVSRPMVYNRLTAAETAPYTKLVLETNGVSMYQDGANQTGFGCTGSSAPTNSSPEYPAVAIPNSSARAIYNLDISGYRGSVAHAYLCLRGNYNATRYIRVVNFYLTN